MSYIIYSPWRNQGLSYMAKSLYTDKALITFSIPDRLQWPGNKIDFKKIGPKEKKLPLIVFETSMPWKDWKGPIFFVPMQEFLRHAINSYKAYGKQVLYIAPHNATYNELVKYGIPKWQIGKVTWESPFERMSARNTPPTITICHISSGNSYKDRNNLQLIINAIKQIKRNDIKFRIHTKHKKEELDTLVSERVIVSHGDISYNKVIDIYKNSDISLYPSKFEGFGVTIMESLTYGIPVITSNCEPMNEHVNGKIGWLLSGDCRRMSEGPLEINIKPQTLIQCINNIKPLEIEDRKRYIDKTKPFETNKHFNKLKQLIEI